MMINIGTVLLLQYCTKYIDIGMMQYFLILQIHVLIKNLDGKMSNCYFSFLREYLLWRFLKSHQIEATCHGQGNLPQHQHRRILSRITSFALFGNYQHGNSQLHSRSIPLQYFGFINWDRKYRKFLSDMRSLSKCAGQVWFMGL